MCSRRVALEGVAGLGRGNLSVPVISFGNSSITCSINRTHERVHSNTRAKNRGVEGKQMTILEARAIQQAPVVRPGFRPADTRRRPRSNRPAVAPMRYRGTGVVMSRAIHRRRPITPATTVVLALIASAITVWLGLVAQFGGVTGVEAPGPGRRGVIQVATGEEVPQGAAPVGP